MRLKLTMKLWRYLLEYSKGSDRRFRHEFVIGPLFKSPLFDRPARLYHCLGCRWTFLVCSSQVVALDEDSNPILRAKSADRFRTFEDGPCPALATLTLALPNGTAKPAIKRWRNGNEPHDLATSDIRPGPVGPWPLLRVFERVRENIGRHS